MVYSISFRGIEREPGIKLYTQIDDYLSEHNNEIAGYEHRWQPGDLLFYATGADPGRINHVAIWYGDGHVIHSISDGPETGVVLTPANAR